MRLHYEENKRTSAIHVQESEISKFTKALPPKKNTHIPFEWMEQSSIHYQAHLERIGDYLLHGNGGWWEYTNDGVEFFDVESSRSFPSTPCVQHFCTTSLSDMDAYLLSEWEKCIEQGVELPAKVIRTYSTNGNVTHVHQCAHTQ